MSRLPSASARRSGFSLLEVLVALAIFAMAAIILGSAYLNILTSYVVMGKGNLDDQDLAFARQQLLTQIDLAAAEAGDEFDTPDVPAQPGMVAQGSHHVKWTADIAATTLPDLFTVTLTCVESTSSSAADTKQTVESFMLLRPTWSQPADRSALVQAETTRIAQLQGKQPK